MRLTSKTEPGGAMARNKGTGKADSSVGKKTPKLKSKAYKAGMMPQANPRGILKDNY